MKKVLLIGTGGTIASEVTEDGLLPGLKPEYLLSYAPEILELCETDCIELFNLDSTNIGPAHWLKIAEEIKNRYLDYDGFVISHGTDTMAYTAAALSYLIQGSPKPIVLTGAQKPIGFDTTDSKINLTDSFRCATAPKLHGVMIVFNGRVISGLRAGKTHSKSFDAFSSINYPNLADIRDGKLLQYIIPTHFDKPVFYSKLDSKVGLIKLYPGVTSEVLEFMLYANNALIIESFGTGGMPQLEGMSEVLDTAIKYGKLVVMTTQVQNEGSDLAVYNVGKALSQNKRVLEAYDMTSEAALAKTMWILGQTKEMQEIRKLFYAPVGSDILTPVL
ncbi:MAG: asparaginase [Ruminococcaceae bacterium]|nr:asparaginase [Oscillospiraceae bacterium]